MGVNGTPVWCDEAERRQREATLAKLAEERQMAEGLLLLGRKEGDGKWLLSSSDDGGDHRSHPVFSAASAMSTSTSSLLQQHGQRSGGAGAMVQQQHRTMAERGLFTLPRSRRGATAAVAAVLVTCLMALPWWL